MRYLLTFIITFCVILTSFAQIDDFPKIGAQDIMQKSYAIDSTANAVILLEKGRTYIQSSDADRAYMVYHHYKVRIKILNQEGYDQANFTIPLYKYGSTFEYINSIKGITYNLENNRIVQTNLANNNIFSENKSEFVKLSKFTLPDIKVGSIIDIEYTVVSPDIFNFRTWNFQSPIPKLKSEYNVLIPGIYKYNVTLKGNLKLADTKSKLESQCLFIYNTRVDCSNLTYIMNDIPAFKEEAHMLAPKNYLSAIYFEMEEAYQAGGGKKTFTKKWADVDRDLLSEKSFGGQLKKQEIIKEKIDPEILNIPDILTRANKIYHWIQQNIKWNNFYGKYGQHGIEDALKNKTGNIADINLALIAALNAANMEAYPILVSSRDNGLPHHLHPVISDFNYVIVGLKINDEIIQLDASDKLLSFGQLPLRAINGEGRIIYSKKSSEWISLENKIISSTKYQFNGKLDLNGKIDGQLIMIYHGLDAYIKRREILNYASADEYQEKLDERLTNIDFENLNISFLEDPDNNLHMEATVSIQFGQEIKNGEFYLNPIFLERTTRNPFNLDERNYPVDLGARHNESYEIYIDMPEGVTLVSAPKNSNLILPENSARYSYSSEFKNNNLSVVQLLSFKKSIYSTDEYFGLKELLSRIIQQLKIDYVFKYQSK